jgi:hypothetical protein
VGLLGCEEDRALVSSELQGPTKRYGTPCRAAVFCSPPNGPRLSGGALTDDSMPNTCRQLQALVRQRRAVNASLVEPNEALERHPHPKTA